MSDNEEDQNDAGNRDDHFFPDRGMIKSGDKTAGSVANSCSRSGLRLLCHCYLLPGFTAGILARSGGNLSGANVSTFISIKLTNGQPKSGFAWPLRSTITPTATTIPPQ